MQDQGAQNVTEALRYTPGVTLQSFGANAFFDSFKLRASMRRAIWTACGCRPTPPRFAIPRIETYGLERLEVLKGPSSGLYGQSDPGGLINMVSKRPTADAAIRGRGHLRIFDRFQGAFDIGGPIDKNGEFLYRIVGLARDSNTPDRLRAGQQAVHRAELHLAADQRHQLHDPVAVSEGRQQGLSAIRAGSRSRSCPIRTATSPTAAISASPGPTATSSSSSRSATRSSTGSTTISSSGRTSATSTSSNDLAARPLRGHADWSDRLVNRTYNYVKSTRSNVALDNQLQADFMTGPLTHKVLVGVDYFNQSGQHRLSSPPVLRRSTLYSPVYGAAIPQLQLAGAVHPS